MALFFSKVGKLALTALRRRGVTANIPNPPDPPQAQGSFSNAFSNAFDTIG